MGLVEYLSRNSQRYSTSENRQELIERVLQAPESIGVQPEHAFERVYIGRGFSIDLVLIGSNAPHLVRAVPISDYATIGAARHERDKALRQLECAGAFFRRRFDVNTFRHAIYRRDGHDDFVHQLVGSPMQTLDDYLEENKRNNFEGDDHHKALLNRLLNNTQELGIDELSRAYIEVGYGIQGTDSNGRVDIVLIEEGRMNIIEAKVGRGTSEKSRRRLEKVIREQLRRAKTFFESRFDVTTRLIGAYTTPHSSQIRLVTPQYVN